MWPVKAGIIAGMIALTGCSQPQVHQREVTSLTWEEAKRATQATELEIVSLIPSEDIVKVDQHEKGTLFSCDDTQHRWTGITYVTLRAGVEAESTVKRMEGRIDDLSLAARGFTVENYRGITDKYVVIVESTTSAEAYLFGEGVQDTISIDSWSECFTLPEGTYPGGKF